MMSAVGFGGSETVCSPKGSGRREGVVDGPGLEVVVVGRESGLVAEDLEKRMSATASEPSSRQSRKHWVSANEGVRDK